MKNFIRVLILVVLSVGLYLVVDFIITKGDDKLAIPELEANSKEFGEQTEVNLDEAGYRFHKHTLSSSDFIDKDVNTLVEEETDVLIKDAASKGTLKESERAAYINAIDTVKVNDSLVSVKVTSLSKKAKEENYVRNVHMFNYNMKTKKKVTLDDLFSAGYKDELKGAYSDNYLLVHTKIEFYGKDSSTTVPYSNLKNYLKSNLLTSENLEISQSEYTSLTARNTTEEATEKKGGKAKATTEAVETTTEKSTESATATPTDKKKPKKQKEGTKVVAFTFDDGPHKTNTDKILDILGKYGAHATFFMQGQNASYYPDVVKRIYESGNELGNHTWDHKNLKNISEAEIQAEVNDAADMIESITGVRPKVVRPPYGGYNDTVKAVVKEPLIRWSVDSLDWQSRDPNQIVPLVMEEAEDGDIILFHDVHETTTPAIEQLVPALQKEGFQIVSVSELFEIKGIDINSDELWFNAAE
jgi:peptidoglycan/xylan/chitin deacetylase (PgdA/CDA1 family)